jgi:3-hydroxyacyl-[acyl-carrier-protein] dehydratase
VTFTFQPELSRRPLISAAERRNGPTLDRTAIERLLPHRDPFLLIDRVEHFDLEAATIVCSYDLDRAASIVAGHFPGRPIWPGVLQVEAIGQAGLCLARLLGTRTDFLLTHILGAEFVRPVIPSGQVEIMARVVSDGLFQIVDGQCVQDGQICCAAAVRGISDWMGDPT